MPTLSSQEELDVGTSGGCKLVGAFDEPRAMSM